MSDDGLRRRLGLFSATSIVVANMVGAGIFTTTGLLMQDLGSPRLMLLLWVVGGVIALCGALCYGELGAAIPRAGGEYAFLSRLLHPGLGFLSGWVSFFAGFSAPIAASAIGFAEYLERAAPGMFQLGLLDPATEAAALKKICAIALIAVFTMVHLRGIELGAKVQNALTVLKVGLVVGLVTLGFAAGAGSLDHLRAQGSVAAPSLNTVGLSLMWILFAYSGWNASAYIGSEIRDPERNLPRSLLLGTGLVMVLYLGLNLLYLYAVPPKEMEGVISIAGLAVSRLFGDVPGAVVSLLVAFALFSSLSAYIILGPRVYFQMARDGYFFRFASAISPRFGVPSRSIQLQGAIAMVMVLLGSFDQILTYMGFSLGIFPLLAVASVFKLRRSQTSRFRAPGYPLVPLLYLSAGTTILALAFLRRPVESSIAIATVLVGIPVFFAFAARQARAGGPADAGR
jgi:APA family basic amino acid/polyamine antiporter